jgi:hypothetical protein
MKIELLEHADALADFDIAKIAEVNAAIELTAPETGQYANLDIKELTRQIRAMNKNGDTATKRSAEYTASAANSLSDAEACYEEAGRLLIEAKARVNKSGESWSSWVFKHCGIKQPRADELIRIAAGVTTVAEVRASTAARVAKHREAKKIAPEQSNVTEDVTLASPELVTPVAPVIAIAPAADPYDQVHTIFQRIKEDFLAVARLVQDTSLNNLERSGLADEPEGIRHSINEECAEATASMEKYFISMKDTLEVKFW